MKALCPIMNIKASEVYKITKNVFEKYELSEV
jgi:hypothetical protein